MNPHAPSSSKRTLFSLLAAVALAATGPVLAQAPAAGAYPARAITLLVPFPPGSATDAAVRALAPAAGKTLGQHRARGCQGHRCQQAEQGAL